MNVLHLNENYDIKGGTEVYINQLQELLPQYGVSSFFIAVSKSDKKNSYNLFEKIFSKKNIIYNEVKKIIEKYVEEKNIDLIHIHGISNPKLINLCLKLRPVIRSMHEPRMFCPGTQKFWIKSETICTKPYGLHCLAHAFTQRCLSVRPNKLINNYLNTKFEIEEAAPKYKFILAMSNYIKDEAILAGIDGNKIIVNPYFTNLIEDVELQNIKDDKIKRIVFIGRLHVSKGPHLLIRALKEILINSKNIILDIIGDGDFKENLIELLIKEKIPIDKIVFYGWLPHNQIIEHIKKSYIVVFPSIYPEAFGIVGIEAMMCSKPVVAFNAGGVSTWLQDNVTGYMVKNKNIKQLIERIQTLLDDETTYEEFSKNARKIALEKFIPKHHINTLIGLYQKVTKNE